MVLTYHGMQILVCTDSCPSRTGSIFCLVSDRFSEYVPGFFIRRLRSGCSMLRAVLEEGWVSCSGGFRALGKSVGIFRHGRTL